MKKKVVFLFVFAFALLMLSNISKASYSSYSSYEEKIYNYDEDIYINEDGSMQVEERIKVYAAGNKIQRGIYRDFPTRYKDKFGNRVKVKFQVDEIYRDGKDEPYHTELINNGVRVYIGDSNKTLSHGYYTYTIRYSTDRQLGFYEDYDEIYWNAIGTGWEFKIDGGTTTVHFPKKVKVIEDKIIAYSGAYGETGKSNAYSYYYDKYNNTVSFTLKKSLNVKEGFTIAVGFEKGAIPEPDFWTKLGWFVQDNAGGLFAGAFFIVLVIWQFFTWKKSGKDPKKNTIIPIYYPPEGLEPDDVKYIDKMGSTEKAFEAIIMNIAIKGFFKFEKEKSNMVIVKTDKEVKDELTEFEKKIYDTLEDRTVLKYKQSLYLKLTMLQKEQRESLKEKHSGKMFNLNRLYMGLSIGISAIFLTVAFIISIIAGENPAEIMGGGMILGSAISFGFFVLLGFKIIFKRIFRNIWKYIIIVMAIPTILIELFFTAVIVYAFGSIFMISGLLIIVSNIIYAILIRAYTKEGMKVKEEIEGFKLFIKTVEGDEAIEKTPEMFDKYFPYAYVLGLENKWAEKFSDLLKSVNYEPYWCDPIFYSGGHFNATKFSSGFSSSMHSGISSASSVPGSSSGSGGGGFSGGGGGRRPEEADGRPKKNRYK
ncbi:MAG: DUF2207 domain-containing protein [Clostridia bacterium]|nr:DUF2207 domain-containing protein [Clostridia bacterium]